MIYGLWLSATGVMTNSHQVDVIANNLANAETAGFKRQLATFRERAPEAKERPANAGGDRFFDNIGGGQLLSPSAFDLSQGQLEETGNKLDLAVNGDGYFMVRDASGENRLTRNGSFMTDRDGNVVLATDAKAQLLDANRQPLKLPPGTPSQSLDVNDDGTIARNGESLAKIGLFNVADEKQLRPIGGSLLKVPASMQVNDHRGQVASGFLERSNVDPAIELTKLMEAQRLLDANANLIRQQDQTMSKLMELGRIG